jgi:hypothetical protein
MPRPKKQSTEERFASNIHSGTLQRITKKM